MRSEVFVYLSKYGVYQRIYDYGVFIQGVTGSARGLTGPFPDGATVGRGGTAGPRAEPGRGAEGWTRRTATGSGRNSFAVT